MSVNQFCGVSPPLLIFNPVLFWIKNDLKTEMEEKCLYWLEVSRAVESSGMWLFSPHPVEMLIMML